jgi:hypothetical protein
VGLQERIEHSRAGRALISALIAVVLAAIVIANLPHSALERDGNRAARPFLLATGLDQDWSVFAPDPRSQVIDLEATVVFPGGTGELWRVPAGGPFVGAYWDYRWRKLEENLIADVHSDLWQGFATWVAGQRVRSVVPSRVDLIRRFYDLYPPGRNPAHSPWRSVAFYRLATPTTAGG